MCRIKDQQCSVTPLLLLPERKKVYKSAHIKNRVQHWSYHATFPWRQFQRIQNLSSDPEWSDPQGFPSHHWSPFSPRFSVPQDTQLAQTHWQWIRKILIFMTTSHHLIAVLRRGRRLALPLLARWFLWNLNIGQRARQRGRRCGRQPCGRAWRVSGMSRRETIKEERWGRQETLVKKKVRESRRVKKEEVWARMGIEASVSVVCVVWSHAEKWGAWLDGN